MERWQKDEEKGIFNHGDTKTQRGNHERHEKHELYHG
jgi:hypothetical protein